MHNPCLNNHVRVPWWLKNSLTYQDLFYNCPPQFHSANITITITNTNKSRLGEPESKPVLAIKKKVGLRALNDLQLSNKKISLGKNQSERRERIVFILKFPVNSPWQTGEQCILSDRPRCVCESVCVSQKSTKFRFHEIFPCKHRRSVTQFSKDKKGRDSSPTLTHTPPI